jgi:hypothetical protein
MTVVSVLLALSTVLSHAAGTASPEEPAQTGGTSEQTEAPAAVPEDQATQRLDFGFDYFESPDGRVLRTGFNYNWAPLGSHSFAATLQVVDANEGSGPGDTLLRYNWAPKQSLTANPWVPNNLGTGIGLLIPTGDPEKGTGGDQWVIGPTLGIVTRLGQRTSLLPQLQYLRSFGEGDLALGTETLSLSFGILHVTRSEFWVQYTPAVSYDADAEQYELDNTLVLGRQFTRRFAASLDLNTMNLGEPHNSPGQGSEFDYRATLKLHWILAF